MKQPRSSLPLLALASFAALAACDTSSIQAPDDAGIALHADHSAHAADASRPAAAPARGAPDLARIRAGSAPYRNFNHAVADGFVPMSPCVEAPPGGMGYHYGNPARIATISVDPARPEFHATSRCGGVEQELVAVEFFVNAEAWAAAGNTAPPSVAGVEYDPPDPDHPDPGVAAAYTLHVWLWKDNPAGMFTPFNPAVSCG